MIFINEQDAVQDIFKKGFENKRANFRELALLAKYYRWIKGLGDRKIEKEIITFCVENDRYFNETLQHGLVQSVVKQSRKYKLRMPPNVQITDKEIDSIKKVRNFYYQKILFVLLVLSKVLKFSSTRVVNKKAEFIGYTVGDIYIRQFILKRFRISRNKFLKISHELYLLGMVEPTYTNALRVLYSDDTGIPLISIDNFDDVCYNYIEFLGGELGYCKKCENEFVKNSANQRYCESCAALVKSDKTRERVRRHRNKHESK